jgi:predicted RNase H-like nuclease (RuvC/YqgF family)
MDEATRFLAEKVHRLEAEVEQLSKGLDQKNIHEQALINETKRLRAELQTTVHIRDETYADARELETEVGRLRAVLERIAQHQAAESGLAEQALVSIARQALEEKR